MQFSKKSIVSKKISQFTFSTHVSIPQIANTFWLYLHTRPQIIKRKHRHLIQSKNSLYKTFQTSLKFSNKQIFRTQLKSNGPARQKTAIWSQLNESEQFEKHWYDPPRVLAFGNKPSVRIYVRDANLSLDKKWLSAFRRARLKFLKTPTRMPNPHKRYACLYGDMLYGFLEGV